LRATPLHDRALVVTSALWQTNTIAVRTGETTVLVDSVVLPGELATLPGALGRADLTPEALYATHAHFDHLLGREAFPDLPLHVAPDTAEGFDEALDELAESDAELYVERAGPPRLDDPVPLGDLFHTVPADGHAADGTAFLAADLGLLLPGDYLTEVEIPLVSQTGSPEAYLATLERLAPLLDEVAVVVPGHGPPLTPERARELLDLDRRYVADLRAGPLRGSGDHRQQRIHEDNVRKHLGAG
jgi:glyoxylase-like metal-dependent hydrolase (beta-lactamase superfamily II)